MLGLNTLSTLASFTSGSDGLVDWSKLAIDVVEGAVGTLAMKYYWKGTTSLHGGAHHEETRTLTNSARPWGLRPHPAALAHQTTPPPPRRPPGLRLHHRRRHTAL